MRIPSANSSFIKNGKIEAFKAPRFSRKEKMTLYKILKNVLVPRPVIEGIDKIQRGESRGEQAEIYYPGAVVELPDDPVLEKEGFIEKVKDVPKTKKKEKEDDK